MRLTREILEQGKSKNGSWSHEQLRIITGRPNGNNRLKGWIDLCIGRNISQENIDKFLSLKDVFSKP